MADPGLDGVRLQRADLVVTERGEDVLLEDVRVACGGLGGEVEPGVLPLGGYLL